MPAPHVVKPLPVVRAACMLVPRPPGITVGVKVAPDAGNCEPVALASLYVYQWPTRPGHAMIVPSLRSTSVTSVVHEHTPEVQVAPGPHASPQPAQFAGSVATSTQ